MTDDRPMMGCGHAANGTTDTGDPVCVIHVGGAFNTEAHTVVDTVNLSGRMAVCCSKPPIPSSHNLAFFQHRPDRETDTYYCGHSGWD